VTEQLVKPQTDESQALVLRATDPTDLVRRATAVADALASVIEQRKLYVTISGRKFVRCEGWTSLAAMLGVTPHEVAVTEQDGVFTAVVELRRFVDGQPVARASAECGAPDELDRNGKPLWSARPRYARRSMALTRATAKACRLAFSWVMALAGYENTPAEADADTDTGEILDAASKEDVALVFAEARKAGLRKDTFPQFYQEVVGRPYRQVFDSDVKPLLEAAAKRITAKPQA